MVKWKRAPAEKYPKDQLAAIQRKLDEQAKKDEDERKLREQNERYQAAIDAGDSAFGKEDWEVARGKYNEAATGFIGFIRRHAG